MTFLRRFYNFQPASSLDKIFQAPVATTTAAATARAYLLHLEQEGLMADLSGLSDALGDENQSA